MAHRSHRYKICAERNFGAFPFQRSGLHFRPFMSTQEYYLVAGGWFLLILLLSIFWYASLTRLSEVLRENIKNTRSKKSVPGLGGLFMFLFRGEYQLTSDQRLIAVCKRLRSLLYGYIGTIGAYIVFLIYMRPIH